MSYNDQSIELIDQRIRAAQKASTAVGTLATSPDFDFPSNGATVIFDGSSVAVPVRIPIRIRCFAGDRVLMGKYGSDWVVTETFTDWNRIFYKDTDQTLAASSTVQQTVNDMQKFIPDGTEWTFTAAVFYHGPTAGDFHFGFTPLAGSSGTTPDIRVTCSQAALHNAAAGSGGDYEAFGHLAEPVPFGFNTPIGGAGAGAAIGTWIFGAVFATIGGTLNFTAAQFTSNATAPVILKGSWIQYTRHK